LGTLEPAGQQETKQSPGYSTHTQKTESLHRQAAKEFSRALDRATKAAASGKPELAVEWCRYASTIVWVSNPGIFYCHELEQLLAEIGRAHLRSVRPPSALKEPPSRFLHVMSTAYETGGHTRVVSRWIDTCAQHAPSEQHSILISMQNDTPLPAWLSRSAQKTGGEFIVFPPGMSWLQMAAEIRLRSFEFDVVVLHIHPNDPLPNMAFYDQPGAIFFFRHADHVFNLGIDVARVVADIRPMGQVMSAHFCSPAPRNLLLPLPLVDQGYVAGGKADARQKLGLPADALIALTIGDPVKFTPVPGYSFPEVVQSLCARNPRVLVLAIGLSESDPFAGLARSVGGQFMPVGVVKDRDLLELYYRAADVYMDAYPSGSLTAVLEAALHGIPVQRCRVPDQSMMWADAATLDQVMRADSNQNEYVARVLEWLEWPEEKRSELGSRFRNAVLRDHCGASWKRKWLDPAIAALISPCDDPLNSRPNDSQKDESSFPGLGKPVLEVDWFDGMLIAGVIISGDRIPLTIRISGLFHSIRPLLFNTTGQGTIRMRLSIFKILVASCVPGQIKTIVRIMRRAPFRKPKRHSDSIK
jgi:hypothetical protein